MALFAINERHLRRLLSALWLPFAMLSAGDAAADGVTPIVITMLGPGAVRMRIARGTTFPCDSGDSAGPYNSACDSLQATLGDQ